jgi:prevent-host-death family protein
MTHMSEGEVSVRELRQNLSTHLKEVRRGKTLAITSRGERVAVLAPIGGELDALVTYDARQADAARAARLTVRAPT